MSAVIRRYAIWAGLVGGGFLVLVVLSPPRPYVGRAPLLALVLPMASAVGAVALFQLVASAAGQGRPPPFGEATPFLRLAVFLLVAGVIGYAYGQGESVDRIAKVAIGIGLPYLAGIAGAAAGTPSVAAPTFWMVAVFVALGGNDADTLLGAALVAPSFFALLCLRLYGFERRDLERIGVHVWAPADVALAPCALALGAFLLFEMARISSLRGGAYAMGAASAAAMAVLLSYLRRRLDGRGGGHPEKTDSR